MDNLRNIVSLTEKKGGRQTKPFVPQTGNPENGNYADWYDSLREGELVTFLQENKNK